VETLLNHLSQSLSGNPFLAYLGVFVGGILSSSSPCVLATIPLVIGYVGGYSGGDRRKALLYSLTFILGLSITFTILGAIASFIGGLFGMAGRTWYFVVGGIAVAIGLHLIGLFDWNLPVPVHLQPKQKGILGAFLLGLIFGIVSSPCATPVLVLILTFAASKGEVAYGTSLLFIYALGHCALIFVAGIATGFVEGFIKSKGVSNITTWGKRVGGIIVVLVGIYLFYLGITL
jgi:cytochrome c biogenesis protein CcdA